MGRTPIGPELSLKWYASPLPTVADTNRPKQQVQDWIVQELNPSHITKSCHLWRPYIDDLTEVDLTPKSQTSNFEVPGPKYTRPRSIILIIIAIIIVVMSIIVVIIIRIITSTIEVSFFFIITLVVFLLFLDICSFPPAQQKVLHAYFRI